MNISNTEHNFSTKQKILNLCFRLHILRSNRFVAEVTFKILICFESLRITLKYNRCTSREEHTIFCILITCMVTSTRILVNPPETFVVNFLFGKGAGYMRVSLRKMTANRKCGNSYLSKQNESFRSFKLSPVAICMAEIIHRTSKAAKHLR